MCESHHANSHPIHDGKYPEKRKKELIRKWGEGKYLEGSLILTHVSSVEMGSESSWKFFQNQLWGVVWRMTELQDNVDTLQKCPGPSSVLAFPISPPGSQPTLNLLEGILSLPSRAETTRYLAPAKHQALNFININTNLHNNPELYL